MSFYDVQSAINSRWSTLVEAGESLPSEYDNGPGIEAQTGRWARVTVLPAEDELIETGGSTNRYRHRGIMVASLFDEIENGDGYLFELAETIAALFRKVTAGGVTYRAPSVSREGVDAGGGPWYQVNLSCPFYSDFFA